MEPLDKTNGVATEDLPPEPERSRESADAAVDEQAETSLAEITAERDRLATEKAELENLLKRRQAEFENFRRRVERERSDLFDFATMETLKALLPVLDDFERALKVETADKEYARGMELIYQRLVETLRKLGVEPISSEVPVFNPHVHHAVEMVETKDHPDETILEEYQRGYYYKGRLLRPAMVKVAVNR